jgi:hypothetical protein
LHRTAFTKKKDGAMRHLSFFLDKGGALRRLYLYG